MVSSEHVVSGARTEAEHIPRSSIICFVGVGFDSMKSDFTNKNWHPMNPRRLATH